VLRRILWILAQFAERKHFLIGQGCTSFDKISKRSNLAQSASAALLELHNLQCTEGISGILGRAFTAVGADEGTIWLLDEKQEALMRSGVPDRTASGSWASTANPLQSAL
jgi:hypothetical protein